MVQFKKTSSNPIFVNIVINEKDFSNKESLLSFTEYLNQIGDYINGLLKIDITVIDLEKLKIKLSSKFNINLEYFTIKQQSHEITY